FPATSFALVLASAAVIFSGHVRPGTLLQLAAIFSGHVLPRPGILLQPGHLFRPRRALVFCFSPAIFLPHVSPWYLLQPRSSFPATSLRPGTLLQPRPSFPATSCALVFASARPSFYPTSSPWYLLQPGHLFTPRAPWYLLQPGHFFRPRAVPK
ncbi:hypothetical protein NSS76_19595, partial [Bacillus sp. FSL R5-0654]|uniref:hypothetical protein n=1 Tax=Bacillus sp. FSL R5-0654 TaxID=2954589 RepID=UPI0030FCBE93